MSKVKGKVKGGNRAYDDTVMIIIEWMNCRSRMLPHASGRDGREGWAGRGRHTRHVKRLCRCVRLCYAVLCCAVLCCAVL
jgi:heme A synthase